MEEDPIDLEIELEACSACGEDMEITMLPIYTNVQCPNCDEHSHVKNRVGAYEIFKRQGVGGMSVVYGATDVSLGRKLAIKLLNEEYSQDEKRAAEFEKEAQITASISHPNVVRVYTVGQAYNRYYIAMELVEGDSLEQLITRDGAQDEEMITRLSLEVVDGLTAAHNEKLLHRDMKPGNVLIDRDGHAKIVDFGLALMTSGGTAVADEVWATPYYVSPETLEMKPEDLRSDIFALGASLYHALSGKPPFSTETRSTTELLEIKRKVPPLEEVAEGVSQALCDVINKAMAFDVEDRYQSYAELRQALARVDDYYHNGRDEAFLSITPEQAPARRRKSRYSTPVFSVIGLLTVAAVLVLVDRGSQKSKANTASSEDSSTSLNSAIDEQAREAAATRQLVATTIRDAQSLLEKRRYREAQELYLKLALNPKVEQETVYWAGMHSAMSAWLAGDSNQARRSLSEVLKKSEQSKSEVSEIEKEFRNLMVEFQQLPAISIKPQEQTGADLQHIVLFVAALKEWEQGNWNLAVSKFRRVMGSFSSTDGSSGAYYEAVSRNYLADYQLLRTYYSKPIQIKSQKEGDTVLQELEALPKSLKTLGRARLNVQAWQRQVKMQQSQLLIEQKLKRDQQLLANRIAAARWKKQRAQIEASIEQYQLSALDEKLKQAKALDAESKSWLEQIRYLSDLVQGLYKQTVTKLDDLDLSYPLMIGEAYGLIVGASADGLFVEDEYGQESVLSWDDVDAEVLIDLHRELMSLDSEEDHTEWQKSLVAFAYLAGLNDFAKLGAEKLANENPEFAKQWQNCMAEVSQEQISE